MSFLLLPVDFLTYPGSQFRKDHSSKTYGDQVISFVNMLAACKVDRLLKPMEPFYKHLLPLDYEE